MTDFMELFLVRWEEEHTVVVKRVDPRSMNRVGKRGMVHRRVNSGERHFD